MKSEISVRPVAPGDAPECSRIIFEAFNGIADLHNFPRDFPSLEAVQGLCGMMIGSAGVYGVVAECGGRIVGSNFLDERDAIRGVGPITIDPAFQGRGAGRKLMQAVLDRAREKGAPGVRLVQDAFNTVSMPLYASLGFDIKEPLVLMAGRPSGKPAGTGELRLLTMDDMAGCAELCRRIHAFDRWGELTGSLKMFHPMGLFRKGRVVAYAAAPTFWPLNHGVAETEEDLLELLLAAGAANVEPLTLLVPTRRAAFFRACLKFGLRVLKPMSLMAMGEYHEPAGAYYPSVSY